MKAIYINLDPYLAAFAAWLKGGKVGPKPTFQPLPLAVTIPLGEDVVLLSQGDIYAGEPNVYTVDGQSVDAGYSASTGVANPGDENSAIARNFSRLAASVEKYYPIQLTSDSPTLTLVISQDGGSEETLITFTVLVRREQASGPVDLVDFTPPAATPSAADIKSALVAAGSGALAGVDLGSAIIDSSEGSATKVRLLGDDLRDLRLGSAQDLTDFLGFAS